jgi:hypothetical protein
MSNRVGCLIAALYFIGIPAAVIGGEALGVPWGLLLWVPAMAFAVFLPIAIFVAVLRD